MVQHALHCPVPSAAWHCSENNLRDACDDGLDPSPSLSPCVSADVHLLLFHPPWPRLPVRSGRNAIDQAVNASDYAIAQFAYLRKLLLVHGRWEKRPEQKNCRKRITSTNIIRISVCRDVFLCCCCLLTVRFACEGCWGLAPMELVPGVIYLRRKKR